MRFRFLLAALALLPLQLFGVDFVAEKKCNLYNPVKLPELNSNDKDKREGEIKSEVKQGEKYEFKKIKTFNKQLYNILNYNGNEYAVSSDCGYVKTEPQPNYLNSAFKLDEKKILNSKEFKKTMDHATISWCGHFGSNPTKENFEKILKDQKFTKEYEEIYKHLNGTVKTPKSSKDIFIKELLEVLFNKGGLHHIICGEPKKDTIGGLHYYYRGLELDKKHFTGISNKQCINTKSNKYIINYSVEFVNLLNEISTKCNTGFVKEHSIVDLVSIGTMVAKATNNIEVINTNENSGKVCLYKYKDVYYKLVRSSENILITAFPTSDYPCLTENKDNTSVCECKFSD